MSTEFIYTTTTHPEPLPYPTNVISLSDFESRQGTNDEIFKQALEKLDSLIGEGEGYVLIVLAAESATLGRHRGDGVSDKGIEKRIDPGLAWWLAKWKSVPHKYVALFCVWLRRCLW